MIFRRALSDTFRNQIQPLFFVVVGGAIGLTYLYFTEGRGVAFEEVPYFWAAISGALGSLILLFLWNLSCAPFRIEREKHAKTIEELESLKSTSSRPANWSAWKSRKQFTVVEAAHLMAGVEPDDGGLRGAAYAYAQDLKWAIGEGKLASISPRANQANRRLARAMGEIPHIPDSEIIRAGALKNWLVEHEHAAAKTLLANLDEVDLLRLLPDTE